MALSDYERVPRDVDPLKFAARWYRNKTTGEMISRWQYQILQNAGITPRAKAKQNKKLGLKPRGVVKNRRYNSFIKAYKSHIAAKLGKKPRDIKVRGDSPEAIEFRKKMKKFFTFRKADWDDKSVDGKVSRWFVEMGMREPEWDMPRGESP